MINNKFIVYEDSLIKIKDGDDIFKRIKEININYEQEHVIVFFLNNQNRILKEEVLFIGGFDSCLICPNTIFRKALLNNSCKIIIAHNHPSKSLTFSYEDLEVYKKLKDAGEIINIKVIDSVIFNIDGYFSVLNSGSK